MAIPNVALQKLLQEVESQAIQSQQQINIIKSQISVKQRDTRLNQLTSTELSQLPKDNKVYEGVGKMFAATTTRTIDARLLKESQALKSEIQALEKRLHYAETTYSNSRDHIEKILQTGNRS